MSDGTVDKPARDTSLPQEANSALANFLEKRAILIVDDVSSSCQIVREIVQDLGARSENISICQSVLLAKKRLEISPVDVVISDLHLKDGKGIDLLYGGLFAQSNPESVFILMTGDPVSTLLQESIRLGVSSIIVKPVTAANLQEHLLFSLLRVVQRQREPRPSVAEFFKRLSKHLPK